jgi:hypothetical protein
MERVDLNALEPLGVKRFHVATIEEYFLPLLRLIPRKHFPLMRVTPGELMNTIRLLRVALILVVTGLLTGCGTLHAWGQKSANTPATFGSGISIPLGK